MRNVNAIEIVESTIGLSNFTQSAHRYTVVFYCLQVCAMHEVIYKLEGFRSKLFTLIIYNYMTSNQL